MRPIQGFTQSKIEKAIGLPYKGKLENPKNLSRTEEKSEKSRENVCHCSQTPNYCHLKSFPLKSTHNFPPSEDRIE